MRTKKQGVPAAITILLFALFTFIVFIISSDLKGVIMAGQRNTKMFPRVSPTPKFDASAAIAKLREQIKGKEKLPADEVFKNIKILKRFPAGTLLNIMRGGFSRSLGVDCTHCHTPENWASEAKPTKQIAREMWGMQAKINNELLKSIDGLKDRRAIVNCTTCHRGAVKPATNLRRPKPKPDEKKETR